MEKKTTVYVRHLDAPYREGTRTKFRPLTEEMKAEIRRAVWEIFDKAGGSGLLKSSRKVFLKPNGIDGQPYCYTRPELVETVIDYWNRHGAEKVFLFENSTQSNATRLVYAVTGYDAVCRRTGAKPVYLDEEKTVPFEFKGRKSVQDDPDGYFVTTFEMPRFVVKNLIEDLDKNLYISLPKLKTHSMAGVTLGVKNQWAFPAQPSRGFDHNYNLHHKLADVLSYVRPDFTLIEGVEGTIYGHYPVTALADEAVLPLKVLVAGKNVVAADIVGARIFGLGLDDVPHLKDAVERGLSEGVRGPEDIEIDGDISMYGTKQPTDLYDYYPPDVKVMVGKERCCKQGCMNNPLTLLQILYGDHGGKGGWTLIIGKGHDPAEIDALPGPVLIAGDCAIREVADRLIARLGRKNVFLSHKCNSLAETAAGMFYLMKVDPMEFAPINPLKALRCLALSKLHGSTALVPSPFSNKIKTV
ncbi:MAG: DUF362 domain-containing protein [Lachnospiraceae bacterium]|nr:DUF362 domain-containing protein [Lachnospiraceae bacterium]